MERKNSLQALELYIRLQVEVPGKNKAQQENICNRER